MDTHMWNILKGEIHEKCIYYEYIEQSADSSLSDYIISVIQMGKSPDEVSAELGGLIGPDYDRNLTQWIYNRMDELKNQPAPTISPPQQQPPAPVEVNEKMVIEDDGGTQEKATARKNRMFSQALSGLGQAPQQRYSSRDHYSSNGRQDQHMTSRDHSDSRPDRRHGRHQQHRSDYHRDHSRSRSRSRSPIRQRERPVHREYKDNTIFARLGKSSPSSTASSSPTIEPSTVSVFDRLGIKKPERVETQESEQIRCKYWPTCDKGDDCTFVHPDTLCPDFPNCPKKPTECLFIHPYTPKKPSHTVTDSNLTEKAIPCRYFPHCTNDQCPFFHPPAIPSFYEPQPYHPPAPTIKRIPVPCKNGEQCTRPGCHFLHPKDSNPAEVICKFDGACTRPGCFYKHTVQSNQGFGNSYNKSLVVNQPRSQRGFAIADDSQVEKIQVGESADLIKPKPQELDTEMDL